MVYFLIVVFVFVQRRVPVYFLHPDERLIGARVYKHEGVGL